MLRVSFPQSFGSRSDQIKAARKGFRLAISVSFMASVRQPSYTPFQSARLPREIRNCIYQEVLTIRGFIDARPNDYSLDELRFRIQRARCGDDRAPGVVCEAVAGSRLAHEVYEEFFRTNRFMIDIDQLSSFLMSPTFRISGNPFRRSHRSMAFNKLPWLRKLTVWDYNTRGWWGKVDESHELILQSSQFQRMEYYIDGQEYKINNFNDVDERIEIASAALTKIRKQVGEGLTVQVEKQWNHSRSRGDMNTFFLREDISWMWEPPSEETKQNVANGIGSHRECIQVLMSTGWDSQENGVGEWATHWLRDQRPVIQQVWDSD